MHATRTRKFLAGFALLGLIALAGCSSGEAKWVGAGGPSNDAGAGKGMSITSPQDGATDVPTGMEVKYTGPSAAKATTVDLTDADGKTVTGAEGYDKSTWVPAKELAYGTKYTAKVTVTDGSGKTSTSRSSFTTMAAPSKTIRFQSWYADNQVLGVAAPLIFKLTGPGVASQADRAAVQKRLDVQTTPQQDGSWYWFSNNEVHYRPKAHWEPGTKITVTAQTGGLPMGDGYYGKSDLTLDATVTTKPLEITIDDKTHKLTAKLNGKVVKTMPASLGKSGTPSSSGSMVIMTRNTQEIFDSSLGTGGTPVKAPGGYRELVHWTMRLTWGGEFIHAAPWSVADQGHRDVSHGCTNVSTANAKWIYENSHIGDPVTVKNTGTPVKWGNGWTDWNVTWDDYLKGSAVQ